MATAGHVKTNGNGYSVRSESGHGEYGITIDSTGNIVCSCPDFEIQNKACKHIHALQIILSGQSSQSAGTGNGKATPQVKRPTYKQDWPAYNAAQVNEQEVFGVLLRQLCETIPQPPRKRGRPPIPMADMIQTIAIKVYSTMSGRRAMTSVRQATKEGLLDYGPSFASIFHYLQKPELTPILEDLIEQSAVPLQGVELDFAADSSGFSTSVYDRWFDFKWGRTVKHAQFVKAHIATGVVSNIITAAKVTPGQSSDSKQLPDLVHKTARNFDIRDFSGDKAYLSKENMRTIEAVGGVPFIPFKINSTAHQGHHKRDRLWETMYHYFHLYRDDFLAHYHKRSNVETTFAMVKAKFGGFVRAKTPTAQVNEVLVKFLCHNIVVLVQATFELGIAPSWGIEVDDRDMETANEGILLAA